MNLHIVSDIRQQIDLAPNYVVSNLPGAPLEFLLYSQEQLIPASKVSYMYGHTLMCFVYQSLIHTNVWR